MLRYPGSKRQLVPFIQDLVKANLPRPSLFVEPFAGGATASLRLAGSGTVQRVLIADLDPLVAALWKTAAFDTEWLVKAVWEEPVTVERWEEWRACTSTKRRDQAMKCLFLNRTTFSGILHGWAGPIGGKEQTSDYTIDCRFPKATIERRIRAVGALAATGRLVTVLTADFEDTMRYVREAYSWLESDEVVFYCDPPYVEKAPLLYEWSFDDGAHDRLANALYATKYRWILSYDDSPRVRARYAASRPGVNGHSVPKVDRLLVPHRYTAAGGPVRAKRDELVLTNLPTLPPPSTYRRII